MAITSVGFIGSGRLAERVARNVVKHIPPMQKFSYKRQRLVSTLLAADPSAARRQVFGDLGFTTTDANQEVLAACDVVFLGTSAREALAPLAAAKSRLARDTLFVSLMGDMRAEQVEQLLCPGAKVIRMMPQNYLEQSGLPKGLLPPRSWAAVRGSNASAQDVANVVKLTGISECVELAEDKHFFSFAGHEGLVHQFVNSISDQALEAVADSPLALMQEAAVRASEGDDSTEDFADVYAVNSSPLGEGRFARVFKAAHRLTGEHFAVKCIKDEELTKEASDMLVAEVGALNRLKHPHVIAHHGFYSEGDNYYLVLDYCNRGSVRTLLDARKVIEEVQAKRLIRQVLSAIGYCHAMGHVHRDVKAENVLLHEAADGELQAKLADFGLSEELELAHSRLHDVCGTPQYLSPEIVSGRLYGKPADIWSAGILSYMMLSGVAPFEEAPNENAMRKLIRLGAIWYDQPAWRAVSPSAKDFVKRMLDINPESRATADELLAHRWLRE
jgi:hypothetical protein